MRRAPALALGAFLAFTAPLARAHPVTTGLGAVADGFTHLFLSADDLLAVAGLALLAGMHDSRLARGAVIALPLAWLAGAIAGIAVAVPVVPAGVTAASLLVLGLAVALDRKPPFALVIALAVAIGLLHGWLNGVAIAAAGRSAFEIAGIVVAVLAASALVAAAVTGLDARWARIAVRVAGSWIAAIGLLLLGWALR